MNACFASLLLKLYKTDRKKKAYGKKNKNPENKFKRRIV